MTKPTTEELKKLLGKVTQGEWVVDGFEITSTDLHPMDCITGVVTRSYDATLIALAPTLAAEVVALREALEWAVSSQPSDDSCCAWVHEARHALSQK